jgi:hypothetical protein
VDGWGYRHLDHAPGDLTWKKEPSGVEPWESTMLVPTWDSFVAASRDDSWSVVGTDNYNREDVEDQLVSTGHDQAEAERLAEDRNALNSNRGDTFYVAKPATYRLSLGMLDCI